MKNISRKLCLPLALVGAAAASPAAAKWREASTNHFIIYSEQSPKELEEFASKLERYDRVMRVMRGLPDEPVSRANRVTFLSAWGGLDKKDKEEAEAKKKKS